MDMTDETAKELASAMVKLADALNALPRNSWGGALTVQHMGIPSSWQQWPHQPYYPGTPYYYQTYPYQTISNSGGQ